MLPCLGSISCPSKSLGASAMRARRMERALQLDNCVLPRWQPCMHCRQRLPVSGKVSSSDWTAPRALLGRPMYRPASNSAVPGLCTWPGALATSASQVRHLSIQPLQFACILCTVTMAELACFRTGSSSAQRQRAWHCMSSSADGQRGVWKSAHQHAQ